MTTSDDPASRMQTHSKAALRAAATKLRRLRMETVGGRKERPAETLRSILDRGWNGTGSVEAVDYILAAGLRYYEAALRASRPVEGDAEPQPLSQAAIDVLAERKRQIEVKGWTPEHDDAHRSGELASAAAVYAAGGGLFRITSLQTPSQVWPYRWECKLGTPRRNLVKAGALIQAEIERLDRAESRAALATTPDGDVW